LGEVPCSENGLSTFRDKLPIFASFAAMARKANALMSACPASAIWRELDLPGGTTGEARD
jgi:hypothetical protein